MQSIPPYNLPFASSLCVPLSDTVLAGPEPSRVPATGVEHSEQQHLRARLLHLGVG